MAKKIPISFKETTQDMKLYAEVMAKEDRSCWIKAILKRELEREKEESKK